MNINRSALAELTPEGRGALMQRSQADLSDIEDLVRGIVDDVRSRGDAALLEYTARFDHAALSAENLVVTDAEFDAAEAAVSGSLRAALSEAVANVRRHHEHQVPPTSWMEELSPGVISGERFTPIASTALYVPRGKGSFPSVMIMLGVPAVLAGVPFIAVCTPPGPDGTIDAGTLVAARMCGIDTVYKAGGAQAVAALAYGTSTVRRVDKIVGPGNRYVTCARRLVYGQIDPGPPAGPSESIVLCDGSADPEIAARELLVEAEHGPDSAALLVTPSVDLADAVERLLPGLVEALPEPRRGYCTTVLGGFGGIVVASSFEDAIAFTNEWAPEHLRVIASQPFEVLGRIRNAGEVMLGTYTSIPFGNFAVGVNAILPTGGSARSFSCCGVEEFLKRSSFAYVSAAGADRMGQVSMELAAYEGFPMHYEAARYVRDRAAADAAATEPGS